MPSMIGLNLATFAEPFLQPEVCLYAGSERPDYAVDFVQVYEVEAGVLAWLVEYAGLDTFTVRHVVCDYHYLSLHWW